MKRNIGKVDKIIRIIFGLLIGAVGLYYNSWWGAVGGIFVITALINWCPLYFPFKINTTKK